MLKIKINAYAQKFIDAAEAAPTANHAELDQIHKNLGMIPVRGPRAKVAARRRMIANFAKTKCLQYVDGVLYRRERDAFVGPRTIRDANGHPY